MTVLSTRPATRERTKLAVIDCDIHTAPATKQTLGKYMSARWRQHHEMFRLRGLAGAHYPRANQGAARTDSWPCSGYLRHPTESPGSLAGRVLRSRHGWRR